LLVVAVGVAVYFVLPRRPLPARGALLEGFAGWLLVLAIAQWLGVLGLAGELLRQIPFYQRYGGIAEMPTATIVEAIGHLALLVFVLVAALAMTRQSRLFPKLLRIELVLLVVLTVLSLLGATSETGAYVTEPKLWIAVALRLVVTGLFAALWFAYSLRSVRVRNTFVR
jgi:hypothetical protein